MSVSNVSVSNEVTRIVLTGGPCGGKTSALAHLKAHFEARGVRIFQVSELATILIGGGADLAKLDLAGLLSFEQNLIQMQMAMEDLYHDLARRHDGPAIILCDRGTMDVSAYLPRHVWNVLLDSYGWTEVALRDQRYDAVIHLESAAVGAPDYYTTANNEARLETPEQAAALDRAVQTAWIGHPHLRVIDSSTSFEVKMARTIKAVSIVAGIPAGREIERKFLVKAGFDPASLAVVHRTFQIAQTYLKTDDGSTARVRERRGQGAAVYSHTVKRTLEAGGREEYEHQISGREYVEYLTERDPAKRTVRKERRCFLWAGQYFELDTFIEPRAGLTLLGIDLDDVEDEVNLPPFIEIVGDVTSDENYTNFSMALIED
jgi:CYTH domain-containing protein/predicted ATPase